MKRGPRLVLNDWPRTPDPDPAQRRADAIVGRALRFARAQLREHRAASAIVRIHDDSNAYPYEIEVPAP